jgi:hypothetical protein
LQPVTPAGETFGLIGIGMPQVEVVRVSSPVAFQEEHCDSHRAAARVRGGHLLVV